MNLSLLCLTTGNDRSSVEDTLGMWTGWPLVGKTVDTHVVPSQYAGDARKLESHVKGILRSMPSVGIVAGIGAATPFSSLNFGNVAFQKFNNAQVFRNHAASFLRNNRLDAASHAVSTVGPHWGRTPLTLQKIDAWVKQFLRFGQFDWVARGLLSCLTVMSSDTILTTLVPDPAEMLRYEAVCFNFDDDEKPSSGRSLRDAIRFAMRNAPGRETPRLLRLADALRDDGDGAILVLEDCAISGYEFRDLVRRHWPESLQSDAASLLRRLEFRFAVVSNGAHYLLRQAAVERGLQNARFSLERSIVIDAFTTEGLAALERGDFQSAKGTPRLPSFVQPGAFAVNNWRDEQQAKTARRIALEIGVKLYSDWHTRTYGVKTGMSEDKKLLAGLGVGGLALALILGSHTPKSSLPIFWCSGQVSPVVREPFTWEPLFA